MPHLFLECSNNIDIKDNVTPFFAEAHTLLEKMLPTQLSSCKSRFIAHDSFYLGSGHVNNAFIHLTLKILAGRSDNLKKQVGQELLKLMNIYFQQEKESLNLQFSVEILDLNVFYFKT